MKREARILVADDDPEVLLLFTTLLADEEYEVYEATTGKECLDAARSRRPDVVLLDVMLPDVSGVEVCRQIKAEPGLQGTFVILVSGARVSSHSQAEGLNVGADGYIVKGVTNREFLARIQALVRIKRAEDALQASEARYRRLFEAAQDGILILDADTGQIDDVNPFLMDMLGYTYDYLLGKKLWEIGAFKHAKASMKAFMTLQRRGYIRYEDLPLRTKDGREIDVEFVSNVYQVNHHRVIQCNVRDITERKLAEEELRKAHDELESRVTERTAQLSESNKLLRQEIAERKVIEERLEESEKRLRGLSTHSRKVREEERKSLSRELHDELGQVLTGTRMDVAWIGRKAPEDNPLIAEKVNSALSLIDAAIGSVQRISMALRPPALDDFGLQEAMRQAAEDFNRRTNIACEIISKPRSILLKDEVSTEAFRIFQEALTNIARHAGAQGVTVSLSSERNRFIMEVRDDGRGITKSQISDLKSIGLTGMRERALAVGGSLIVMGTRGKGTVITLSVPLGEGKEEPDTIKRRGKRQP